MLHFTIVALLVLGFLIALRITLREELKGVRGITTTRPNVQRSAAEARGVRRDRHDAPFAAD